MLRTSKTVHSAAADVEAFIRGVAAAPEPYVDPDAWIKLLTPNPSHELRQALSECLAEARAMQEDVLNAQALGKGRLQDLRREMKRREIDGFIVPHSDEHQGEYLPLRAERLAWLTGFTGSAGFAVILAKKAALFVDGRYTLQVRTQTDRRLYAFPHLSDHPPTKWIAENLPKKARLGYDPWLLTPHQVTRFQQACHKAGGHLVALQTNPIDHIWTRQPPAPISPVKALPVSFAGKSSSYKRKLIANLLVQTSTKAAVLTAPDSICWLLNIRGGDVPFSPLVLCFAILHDDASADLFIDRRKISKPVMRLLGDRIRIHDPDQLRDVLDKLGKQKKAVQLNKNSVPSWIYDRLNKAGATIMNGDDPCQSLKSEKNTIELKGIRSAHHRDGAALTRFLAWLAKHGSSGTTSEIEAADVLEGFRRENENFQGLSFPTISGAGANGAIVHYRVTPRTNQRLKPGSLYLVDSGAQYLDGTTDVTRTIAIGEPKAEMRKHFTLVLKGHIALGRAQFPYGTTGAQLDGLARQPLWHAGLDYDHGTGHGVGHFLNVHEGPQRISKAPSSVPLQPGMVISNEPGYYKSGAYGIRIENLVTVIEQKNQKQSDKKYLTFETLTLAPIDLNLIDAALLDKNEKEWLNAYHARVCQMISPLVDAATKRWLKIATQPIK
ncbi:MAG: aminopeptidase P family protein [Rhodospirillales bacterium]